LPNARTGWIVAVLAAAAWAHPAAASDICAGLTGKAPDDAGARIAAIACTENRLWFSPFIDVNGRLASMQVAEAESAPLGDTETPTWHRVVEYWKASGLLARMQRFDGAADCAGLLEDWNTTASCRAFLVDMPWSAAFVSYVVGRAGIAGFSPSARHIDFIRDAYRDTGAGPYRLADPDAETPAPGDLLCFARMPATVFGHDAFLAWLERTPRGGFDMHCDIVVAAGAGRMHLVGGNVLQGVTMRMLPLNRRGRLWGVQRPGGAAAACHPGNEAACSFNRQDWVALLKLNPAPATTPPAEPPCCEQCTLPMPAGVQRCEKETGPVVSPLSRPTPQRRNSTSARSNRGSPSIEL
jgi:hypothetical protein